MIFFLRSPLFTLSFLAIRSTKELTFDWFTGVAISSNCLGIQILFQRHNFNVTDLLLKPLNNRL